MGFKVAAVLCLSFVLAANAQSIFNDLASKENQLNCLLGKPNCISPPPPPTSDKSPPPPGAEPPTMPPSPTPPSASPPGSTPGSSPPGSTPGSSPPGSTPGSSPPGSTPGSSPPGSTPGSSPGFGPGSGPGFEPSSGPSLSPAPAPGPSANGNAVTVVSLAFPDGYVVTDAVRAQLASIIQMALGNNAQVQLQIGAGRKLLSVQSTLTLLLSQVTDCSTILEILESLFSSGAFVRDAQSDGIPLQAASLNGFACTKPGEEPVTVTGPPATAPGLPPSGSITPSGGPISPVTPAGSPTTVTPASGPITPSSTTPAGAPMTNPPATAPDVPSPAPFSGR